MSGTVICGSSAGQSHPASLPRPGLTRHRLAAPENPRHGAKRVSLTVSLLVLGLGLLPTPQVAVANASKSQAFVAGVNEARTSHGLRPLRVARSLQRSSAGYSRWMLDNQRFEHPAAIRAPGYFRLRGEVLARSAHKHPPAARIVRQWLASPSHRAVLLKSSYRFVGVGLAYGRLGNERGTLVTGHFGAR